MGVDVDDITRSKESRLIIRSTPLKTPCLNSRVVNTIMMIAE